MRYFKTSFFLVLPLLAFLHSTRAHAAADELDPAVLQILDSPGAYSLATVLGAQEAERAFLEEKKGDPNLARLKVLRLSRFAGIKNSKYDSLAEQINLDVVELKKLSGEKMAFSSEQAELLAPQGNVARHFEPFVRRDKPAGWC